MTIKKKILLSNISMLLLLLTLVLVITFYILRVFIKNYDTYEIDSVNLTNDNSISVYELQSIFNNLLNITVETDGDLVKSEFFSRVKKLLDKSETLVEVTVDNITTYRTEGYDSVDINNIACELTKMNLDDHKSIMYSDTDGFMYRTIILLKDGRKANVMAC